MVSVAPQNLIIKRKETEYALMPDKITFSLFQIIAENEISPVAHQAGIPPAVTTLYSEKVFKGKQHTLFFGKSCVLVFVMYVVRTITRSRLTCGNSAGLADLFLQPYQCSQTGNIEISQQGVSGKDVFLRLPFCKALVIF